MVSTSVPRLGVALVAALALLGAPAVSNGAPAPVDSPRTASPSSDSSVVVSPAGQKTSREVRDYWTPERMANAEPIELPSVDGDDAAAPDNAPADTTERSRIRVPKTAGKLFFSTSSGDAVCSAAAIKTKRRNQVITAGHCVNAGPWGGGEWFGNFVFVPRYNNGRAPNGVWVGTRAYAFTGWIERGTFGYDQAIIKFKARNGRKLVGAVGGNRLKSGASQRQRGVRIWGWPAEAPYNGETAKRCDGRTTRWPGTRDARMRCPMNGGASGGPWLLRKGRHKNTGIIWAVTSRRTTSGPKYLLAAPLPRAIWKMVRVAN